MILYLAKTFFVFMVFMVGLGWDNSVFYSNTTTLVGTFMIVKPSKRYADFELEVS